MTSFIARTAKTLLTVSAVAIALTGTVVQAESPADLNDLEIAHVAYTADSIDIRYAHLALAISKNAEVRQFASNMINDHSHVNEEALALLDKLNAQPADNFLSRQLNKQDDRMVAEMSQLTGAAFDQRYAANELAYHQAVNELVAGTFIPNIDNAEVKALFEDAIALFEVHEEAAAALVEDLHAPVTANSSN
jgi:putative membrane protein